MSLAVDIKKGIVKNELKFNLIKDFISIVCNLVTMGYVFL